MKLNKLNLNHNLIQDYNTIVKNFYPVLSPIKQETIKTKINIFNKQKFNLVFHDMKNEVDFSQCEVQKNILLFNSLYSSSLTYPKSILRNLGIKNFNIEYKEFTKIILIIFLSEYLSIFMKNFISSSKIQLNIKLVHSLNKNINILGKYLSKELITNPRGFKNLFKQYTKND